MKAALIISCFALFPQLFLVESSGVAGNCTTNADCNWNGLCLPSGYCKCFDKYATFPADSFPECNYEKLNRLYAASLEGGIGATIGAGDLYLGNKNPMIGSILIFWVGLIATIVVLIIFDDGLCLRFVCYSWLLCFVIYTACRFYMMANGRVKDSNGIDTY